jgi:peroxiredoxin Q/BCP
MLVAGDVAPDFVGVTADGGQLRSADLRGAPLILYFYPRANSAGCTRESIGFAHYHRAFADRGIGIVGVSVDDQEDQKRFAEKCSLPFPLIADSSKEIARAFGVLGAFGLAKRVTFFLDANGRVVDVVDSFLPGAHVQRARARWLGPTAGAAAAPATDRPSRAERATARGPLTRGRSRS